MMNRLGTQSPGVTTERRAVNTFVVRRWQAAGAETRYEIAHVQSGRRTVATGDAVAAAWIGGFGQGEPCSAGRLVAEQADVA